jgi:hypothetical protein
MRYPIPQILLDSNDMAGSISANWQQNNDFDDFATKIGIDLGRFRPITITYNDEFEKEFCIYAIDLDLIKSKNETLHSYAIKNNGTMPVVKFKANPKYSKLINKFAHISYVITEKWADVQGFDEIREEVLY